MRTEKQVTIGRTVCRYTYNRTEIDTKVPDAFYKILVEEIRRKQDAKRTDGSI